MIGMYCHPPPTPQTLFSFRYSFISMVTTAERMARMLDNFLIREWGGNRGNVGGAGGKDDRGVKDGNESVFK
jgi:hypothetical protein